jgi:molybdopterin-binding protein
LGNYIKKKALKKKFKGGSLMETTLSISGRNKLKGKVTNIVPGIVTAEVEIDIGNNNTITGVITKSSLEELGLRQGEEVTALIKATSVMFMK